MHLYDAVYTMDAINRLTSTVEGHISGGAISGSDDTRSEAWSKLTQTGNWQEYKFDATANGTLTDPQDVCLQDGTSTFGNDMPGRPSVNDPPRFLGSCLGFTTINLSCCSARPGIL